MAEEPHSDRYEEFLQHFLRDQSRIFAYIRSLLPQYADAQDVFQRCSLTLWRHFDEFDHERLFLPWACTIAMNEVRNFRRTNSRDRLQFSDDVIEQLAESRAESLAQRDRRLSALKVCIESLKQQDRELIRDVYSDLRSVADVAGLTGKAMQSLYNRLSGLRRALLQCIERRISLEEVAE